MKITSFDRTNLRLLGAAIDAALAPVATQFGISFNRPGCRFTSDNATMKIEAAVVGNNGQVMSREREDFKEQAPLFYGIPATALDSDFKFRGETYTIIGLKSRSHKNPILGKQKSNSKTYKFSPSMVKAALNLP